MIPLDRSFESYRTELKVKIKDIKAERSRFRDMGAMEQYIKATLELADTWDNLGRAYQQEGDEESAKHAFASARTLRREVSHE
jgi:cytochrome c-type biogenesis protein CcmH/NrfG